MKDGIVYLVGAGPGDPKLITVYGLECIQKADVIAYDRLVNPKLLEFAKKDAELVYCGKLPGKHHLIQDEIHTLLVEKAQEGKIVTRLKGGDPFVFGRGAEEAEILKNHGIAYEIVPGITAGIAAPAYAGIPVTHRDFATSFALVTGHGREEKGQDFLNWPALATGIDTVAFYMSVGNIAYISKKLIENGRKATTPVAVIEWGTTEQQRTITGQLAEIASIIEREGYHNPSMIIVGEVVNVREKIQWFEEQGLALS
ncbi:uroporphyrinogen-III C-methyltransferase [Lysinibacillus xylanilyticus]|uniref:uroporphyrinogen-III C-methyltransferase n=1 Tax=Lysinibacillus xylanilyticus TaxID=582475 RepID=A0ABT4EQE2_9BACI|nr:uroporphyrinogen-III C-methyltransferase [Lysinibacillus xylanilyticus]MCY9547748.1 uroporphyrinogen-III C-methyltransferase [Lysinibacillus xylanilyticus]MED3804373.1 uroporphyrinogen-III C-methyltransferase [Lysinibacillus xylanilyticus]